MASAGLLAACGGGGSDPTATADSAQRARAMATEVSAESVGTTVAPYFATWAWGNSAYNVSSLMDAKNKTGLKGATLAFIVAGSSGCTWDDGGRIIDVSMNQDIASFRSGGGKV